MEPPHPRPGLEVNEPEVVLSALAAARARACQRSGYRPLRTRLPSSPPKTHITSDDVIAALWVSRAVGSVPEGVISVQMGLPAWHTED